MAVKLQRPTMRDPRLIVGIALVIASVIGVSWVVQNADKTMAVYQARAPIVSGAHITSSDVTVVHVNLGEATDHYLLASQPIEGSVAVFDISQGELIASTHIGSPEEVNKRPVPVEVDRALAALVKKGDTVDLWWHDAASDEPQLIAPQATIWHSPGAGSSMGAAAATIYVVVEAHNVPTVLGYQQRDGVLTVLPVVGASS